MASKPFVLGGPGGPPDLNGRLRIINGLEVVVDKGAAEQIKKASPPPKSYRAEDDQGTDRLITPDGRKLDQFQTRAALLGQVLNLVYGSSAARMSVVEALVAALNNNTITLQGQQTELALNQQIANALAGALNGISANERLAMERSQGSSKGIASAVVAVSEPVLASATAVAALSCEALQAQTKAFEEESRDSQPYKSVACVAEELKGLLIGSQRINAKKAGVGAIACITSVPEVHGAAEAAWSAAAATARAGLGAGCPDPAELLQKRPSMQLLPKVLELACCLRAAACLSIARSTAYGPTAACFKGRLQALNAEETRLMQSAGEVFAASQAASRAADVSEAWNLMPDLGAALLAADCLRLLQDSINVEACLALSQLRKQPDGAADGAAEKKKGKKQAAGAEVRKGISEMTTYLEDFAGDAATQLAARLDEVDVNSSSAAANGGPAPLEDSDQAVEQALGGVSVALDPLGRHLGPLLAILDEVIQANMPKRKPKVAKGARDFGPKEMTIRKPMFKVIENVFERHGGKALETPVFERKDTLSNKYGEDSKLMFDLADQGGEILALRFDHTVPLARYVALNSIAATKRYTIGRSYRRDQPQANRGRYREFYQADFDIVGKYAPMAADAEALKVLVSILSELKIGDFLIKISHRKLLDAMLTYCGVPKEKFHPICSAIDKLDKEPWEVVRTEMVEQKGLPAEVADNIQQFMVMKGSIAAMTDKLKGHDWDKRSEETKEAAEAALKDMEVLSQLLEAMGADLNRFRLEEIQVWLLWRASPNVFRDRLSQSVLNSTRESAADAAHIGMHLSSQLLEAICADLGRFSFELSLARGLDYYTGVIFEAVLILPPGSDQENVGSIAAGGRYDELVGQFSSKTVPCVGMSVGVERVFTVLERKAVKQAEQLDAGIRESKTQVLIASPGNKDLLQERCKLAAQLWNANIPAECGIEKKPGFMDQIKRAEKEGIPVVVVMGEEEIEKGIVKVRDQWLVKAGSDREREVPRSQLVEQLQHFISEAGCENALLTKPV